MSFPSALTIFAANDLVFLSAGLAFVTVAVLLRHRPQRWLPWLTAALLVLGLSLVFSHIAAALYDDPRPFVVEHVTLLIPHRADNGFPSDHGLLAAAIVVLVGLAAWRAALPFTLLAVLVDAARVAAGVHHVIDMVGSTVCVALALLVAWKITPPLVRRIAMAFAIAYPGAR